MKTNEKKTQEEKFTERNRGLSKEGRVKVLTNLYEYVEEDFVRLLKLLDPKLLDQYKINALVHRVCTGLQSVLDVAARTCDDLVPIKKDTDKIYFSQYLFSAWPNILELKVKLMKLKFNGRTVFEIANLLKHEVPWMGLPSESCRLGIVDIYSTEGRTVCFESKEYNPAKDVEDQHVCLIRGFIHWFNHYTRAIITEIKEDVRGKEN